MGVEGSSEPCPSCGQPVGDHVSGRASSCPLAGPIKDHHEFMEAARRSHQEVARMSRVARLTGRASLASVAPEPEPTGKGAEGPSDMLYKRAARTGQPVASAGADQRLEAERFRRLADVIRDPGLAFGYRQKAAELDAAADAAAGQPDEPVMRRWVNTSAGLADAPWGYQPPPPRSN